MNLHTPFDLKDLLKALLGTLIVAPLSFGLYLFLLKHSALANWHPSLLFALAYAAQTLGFFLPLWFFVIRRYKPSSRDWGFVKVSPWKLLKNTLLLYLLYLLIASLILTLLSSLEVTIPGFGEQESFLPLFGEDLPAKILAFCVIVLVAPVIEEFFFRGFVFRTLLKNWPFALASVASALLFALVHMELQAIGPLFLLGLLLNYSYYKSGSLWGSISFHVLNNFIAFIVELSL